MLSIDCEFHTLLAVSTSLCHDHAKNSQNRVRTEFLRTTGEPDVSGRHTVLPFLLEVGQNRQDPGWLQILQIEFRYGPLVARREKSEKQHEAVAVTMDGVGTGSANTRQVISEVIAHDGAQQIGKLLLHSCPPFRPGTGTTSSP